MSRTWIAGAMLVSLATMAGGGARAGTFLIRDFPACVRRNIAFVAVSAAILLAVTTRIGRRALVGFVALFAFLGFSNADFVIGLPFLVLAGWLLYRSYKVQKEATNKVRADRAAGITPVDTTRPGRAPRPNPTTARGSRSKGPALPEGNKRYTPKKPTPPPPPAPKPSWSERRAAKSAGSSDSAS